MHPFARDHQPRPGQRAAEDVGVKGALRRPDLQVLAQKRRIDGDTPARAADAVAKFNVLDRGHAVGFHVEAADLQEHVLPDRAAPGPEGVGIALRGLVVEAMHQVLVAGKPVLPVRRAVIGPEDRRDLGVGKGGADLSGAVVMGDDVAVDEPEDVAHRRLCRHVARQTRPAVLRRGQDTRANPARDLGRAVGGAVIDNDDLRHLAPRLHRHQGRQNTRHQLFGPEGRHHDRDCRATRRHICPPAPLANCRARRKKRTRIVAPSGSSQITRAP